MCDHLNLLEQITQPPTALRIHQADNRCAPQQMRSEVVVACAVLALRSVAKTVGEPGGRYRPSMRTAQKIAESTMLARMHVVIGM
jgi:hypothetical protein